MEGMVFQAAQEGNVISLRGLLQHDPLIFDRLLVNYFSETPLRIAAMLGHVNIVEEIVRRKPDFVRELNLNKSTPLHLASARGFIDVVRALISVDPEMCLARDKDGRNPLHLAAMKGRVDVLKELLQAKPDAARATVHRGETILHVCVIHNWFEALKLLVDMISDEDFQNAKDDNGDTILHLAVADKQSETINYLLLNTGVEVNATNLYGLTAMDVLIQSRQDVKDMKISQSLSHAGAVAAKVSSRHSTHNIIRSFEDFVKQQQDWLERKRNVLMIVASLIATMAFQASMNPPGGFWQETKNVDSDRQGGHVLVAHLAEQPIWADSSPSAYGLFLTFNTISFTASMTIILLLISGLPLRRRVFVWILMVIMWIAVIATGITYAFSMVAMTAIDDIAEVAAITLLPAYVLYLWIGLLVILPLGHLVRFIIRIIKSVKRKRKRKRMELDSNIGNIDKV